MDTIAPFFCSVSHYLVTNRSLRRYALAMLLLAGAVVFAPRPARAADGNGEPNIARGHGPSSASFPSHTFQLAGRSAESPQIGVNFGLLQLALHGFNAAAEVRYKRLWLEYSHGQSLTLNHRASLAMTPAEREAGLHVFVPYTTGFGVGVTLVDELWLGLEFKTHRYEVATPTGDERHYQTYSVGPVLGYKFFIWRGLHANLYARYWPTVATTLDHDEVTLAGPSGPTVHHAHAFDFFANASLGWAFDL